MKLSRIEQEVVITFNAEEDFAEIYTANSSFTHYCRKMKLEQIDGNGFGPTFKVPKKAIRIRLPKKRGKLSEERLKALRENIAKAVSKRRISRELDIDTSREKEVTAKGGHAIRTEK